MTKKIHLWSGRNLDKYMELPVSEALEIILSGNYLDGGNMYDRMVFDLCEVIQEYQSHIKELKVDIQRYRRLAQARKYCPVCHEEFGVCPKCFDY